MKFSIGLPTDHVEQADEFVTGPAIMEMAAAAEAAGFDAAHVTDHPAPDAKWLAGGGHHALDPFVALSFAAASTSMLRLQTHVLVLPYRNPLLAAKSVLSLHALSGGRMLLGVAPGYLKPEYRALGFDFDTRNERLDEAIDVIRAVLTDDTYAAEGDGWSARGVEMRPKLDAPPPIWIGGNSRAAMRRAVERGDGWVPFPNPPEAARAVRTPILSTMADLTARVDEMREHAAAVGRTAPIDICFAPFSMLGSYRYDLPAVIEELHELEALGVTWVCVGAPAKSRAGWREWAEQFATDVMAAT